jgi:hypothetical protein
MQSPEDGESLRELDAWLRGCAHSQAAIDEKIAEYSDRAMNKILQSNDYIDCLAGILEHHGFGLGSRCWTREVDLAKEFWAKVSKARVEKDRRMNLEEQIRSVLPKGMFDHYEWNRLAYHSLSGLKCVRIKCSSWESWRYLLDWAMLHRDKGYRDNWQKLRNTAVLIGQHHYLSAIKIASSPVEKKDIMCAKLWLDKCPMFEQNRRKHWEWDKVTTIKYMRMHHLTFDDNGFIVPHTGSFNESLVEQVLFRRSHAAREGIRMSQKKYRAQTRPTRDQHIDVLPSPNMSNPATRHRLDCPETQSVEPSLSSIPTGASEVHSQSPACISSPEVGEHEAKLLNVGVSEALSTPLDYIEALSPQVTFHHGPLTPPSSAGGLVPRSWKQYVKMIDDTMSCISKDDGVRHTYDTETVLGHLRIARNLCALQYGEESCSVQRQVVRQTENAL